MFPFNIFPRIPPWILLATGWALGVATYGYVTNSVSAVKRYFAELRADEADERAADRTQRIDRKAAKLQAAVAAVPDDRPISHRLDCLLRSARPSQCVPDKLPRDVVPLAEEKPPH